MVRFKALTLLLSIPVFSSAATIISFDGLTQGTNIDNTYQSSGVLFSNFTAYSTTAGGEILFSGTGWVAASGCNEVWTDDCGIITFVDPVNASIPAVTDSVSWNTLGLENSGGGISGFTVTAYNLLGQVVGTQNFVGGWGPITVGTQSINTAGIHELIITGRNNGGALGFDNLTFDGPIAATPEPAMLLPLGLGLLALGLRWKRA